MTRENFRESIGPQQPEPDTKKLEPNTEEHVYRARPNRDRTVTAIPGILWRAQARSKKESLAQEGEKKPSAPTEAGEQSLDARVLELYALAQEYALEPATVSAARHTERVEALASVSGTNEDEYLAKLQNIFENESSDSTVSQSNKILVDQEKKSADAELKQLAGERRARLKSAMLDLLDDDHLRTRYEAEVASEKSLMRVPETRKRLQEIFTTRALRNRLSAERRILLVQEFLAQEQLLGGGKRSKTAGRTPEAIRNLERGTVLAEEKENTITARLSAPERGFLATENLLQRKRELDAKGFVLSPSRERLLSQIADLTAKGFRVFLGGPTGTGKTSIALFALKEMTGGNFSWVTWTGDTSVRDLFGSPKLTTTKEGKMESGMTKGPVTRGVIGEKSGVLHEELTAGQTGVQMSMKTLWAAKPGEQINLPGFNGTEFTKEQLIELATGNLKGQRHAEREAMDPAVAREFKAIEVPFMSSRETRDYLILPELIDRSGVMPLSRKEVEMVDQFCKAAELSQLAYLEEIPEEVKENDLYKIISPTGDDITLTGVFLDTGTVKDLFSGWRASGKPLSVHLSEGLRRFVDENPYFREAKTERETIKNILRAYGFNLDIAKLSTFFTPTGGSIKSEQPYQKPSELGYLIPTPPLSSEDEFMPQGEEEAKKPETAKRETGLETLEEIFEFDKKSLTYIERLLKEGANPDFVALGLAGLDSREAWALRELMLKTKEDGGYGANPDSVARGLAGLYSKEAWALRELMLKTKKDGGYGADPGFVARGLAGDFVTFVWRLKAKAGAGTTEAAKGVSIPETKLEGPVAKQI